METTFFVMLGVILFTPCASGQVSNPRSSRTGSLFNETILKNDAFEASSVLRNSPDFQAYRARIALAFSDKKKVTGYAWCPKEGSANLTEWIQVDFKSLKVIHTIFTTGRGEGNFKEFVPRFIIKYQRVEDGRWIDYSKYMTTGMWGNNDPRNTERNHFKPNIIAKRLRVYPYSGAGADISHGMCFRYCIYGRNFPDEVISYKMPQGDPLFGMTDQIYDGLTDRSGELSGGLGQLVDNTVNTLRPDELQAPGGARSNIVGAGDPLTVPYVGWRKIGKRAQVRDPRIEIIFEFFSVRNFTRADLYPLSKIRYKNQLMSASPQYVMVEFSVGGRVFGDQAPIQFSSITFKSNVISIPLKNRYAKFVRVSLYFRSDSDWIALSEVVFHSDSISKPIAVERETPKPVDPPVKNSETERKNNGNPVLPIDKTKPSGGGYEISAGTNPSSTKEGSGKQVSERGQVQRPSGNGGGSSGSSRRTYELSLIITIICCFIGSVICVGLGVFVYLKLRKNRHEKTMVGMEGNSLVMGIPTNMSHQGGYKQYAAGTDSIRYFDSLRAAAMSNGGGGSGGAMGDHASVHRPLLKDTSLYTNVPTTDDEDDLINAGDKSSMGRGSAVLPYAAYSVPMKWYGGSDRMALGPEYASTSLFSLPPPSYPGVGDKPVVYQSHGGGPNGGYPTLQIVHNPVSDLMDSRVAYGAGFRTLPKPPAPRFPSNLSIQGVIGNATYSAPQDLLDLQDSPLTPAPSLKNARELPLSSLRLLERLGGGHFGEVHLAELVVSEAEVAAAGGDDLGMTASAGGGTRSRLVAVKMLRKDATEQARLDLQTETTTLTRLSDPNLARLVGICREQGGLCVVVEYGKHGDLHQFMRSRYPGSPDLQAVLRQQEQACPSLVVMQELTIDGDNSQALSYGCLIYMAMQVASGMKHLENLGISHRDLACRNCLVDSRFTVKISDLAMCRRLYATDYYRVEGRTPLPIRWMAWESLMQGKYSFKSDVWSFAVTLWEILTFCRQQPLAHISDDCVIDNLRRISLSEDNMPPVPVEYPHRPASFPKEIYDLMQECWQRKESHRPNFCEIHMFLQRKNLGFNADEEYQLSKASAGAISPMLT